MLRNNKIRVRFAPSPTGYLHVGGLRTYLYNWLFAKKNKGEIILRIEDTDRQRYVEGATENLIKTLKQIGLPWDKGPFIQSQRIKEYRSFAQQLVNEGHAYYCFCSEKELKEMKEMQVKNKIAPQYDRRCRQLSDSEIKLKLKSGQPYVIRLKVPESGVIEINDLIRGKIEFDLKNIDDQILLKSDGWPTYHLANVIDDHFMRITHVIRGEDWLPSTPKHILIYQMFNWPIPSFAHLPLLLNPDHSKLSKRQGDVSVEDYLSHGFLPEALINFLALLGWNPGDNQEIFSLKQLIKNFSLEKIQKSAAIFNREKLDWMNGYYIRKLSLRKLTNLCLPYLTPFFSLSEKGVNLKKIKKIVSLQQERLKRLEEINELSRFFFEEIEYSPSLLCWKTTTNEKIKINLTNIKMLLTKIPKYRFKSKTIIKKLQKIINKKNAGEILWPLRVCLSGLKSSPPPEQIAEILGKKETLKRIEKGISKLNQ